MALACVCASVIFKDAIDELLEEFCDDSFPCPLLLLSADADETTSGTETAIANPAVAATMRFIFFMGSFSLFAFWLQSASACTPETPRFG